MNKLYRKHAYSPETFNLLDRWTLRIKDKEIEKEYAKQRTARFNKMFWPQVAIYLLMNSFGWYSYLNGQSGIVSALRPLNYVLIILLQAIPRYFCNHLSVFSVVPCTFLNLLMIFLIFRGYLPEQFDSNISHSQTELIQYSTLIGSFVINCLTFFQTLVCLPVLHLSFFYWQLQITTTNSFSAYTGEALTHDESA